MGFCASDQSLWKAEFKPSDEQLTISPEHNRNFIDCVKSRQETICPVEMAIRCDTICHLSEHRRQNGTGHPVGSREGRNRRRRRCGQDAAAALPGQMEGLVSRRIRLWRDGRPIRQPFTGGRRISRRGEAAEPAEAARAFRPFVKRSAGRSQGRPAILTTTHGILLLCGLCASA